MTEAKRLALHESKLRRNRKFAQGVMWLGIVISVLANIAHARSHPISQAIAAWPPIALFLTVELISRIPVHRRSLAAVRILATLALSLIAAWVSYWHMVGVSQRYGETGATPYLLPLSADGMIVVASIGLVELAGRIAATRERREQVEAEQRAAEQEREHELRLAALAAEREAAEQELAAIRAQAQAATQSKPEPERIVEREPERKPAARRPSKSTPAGDADDATGDDAETRERRLAELVELRRKLGKRPPRKTVENVLGIGWKRATAYLLLLDATPDVEEAGDELAELDLPRTPSAGVEGGEA